MGKDYRHSKDAAFDEDDLEFESEGKHHHGHGSSKAKKAKYKGDFSQERKQRREKSDY